MNAFANASAAPAKTSVTDSFRGFLGTLPENAGMSGGFSMSSYKFEHIILDHNRNLGVSKLLPCFSLRALNTVSISSSSCHLDALASEYRFRFERTSPLLSDCLPSHQSVISPVRYLEYIESKFSLVTSHNFACCRPSKYPTLKFTVSGTVSAKLINKLHSKSSE